MYYDQEAIDHEDEILDQEYADYLDEICKCDLENDGCDCPLFDEWYKCKTYILYPELDIA